MRAQPLLTYYPLAALILSGCVPTQAQLTATRAGTTIKGAIAQYRECTSDVRKTPEFAALDAHLANPETGQFTMEQLTDKAIPTAQEAHLLASLYDDFSECRSSLKTAVGGVRPDLVPVLTDEDRQKANIVIKLVQRQISWGDAAQAGQAVNSATQEKLAEIDHAWKGELEEQNREELEQRRASAALTMQYLQNQQMINAVSRPVNTTCFAAGSMMNCTSQ